MGGGRMKQSVKQSGKPSTKPATDIETVARRVASRQAKAAERYGKLLGEYGSKKISTGDFGARAYQFAVEESAESFGDFVDIGMGYWRDFVGTALPGEQGGGKTATRAAGSKRARV